MHAALGTDMACPKVAAAATAATASMAVAASVAAGHRGSVPPPSAPVLVRAVAVAPPGGRWPAPSAEKQSNYSNGSERGFSVLIS